MAVNCFVLAVAVPKVDQRAQAELTPEWKRLEAQACYQSKVGGSDRAVGCHG
jgi:hypothetical protein